MPLNPTSVVVRQELETIKPGGDRVAHPVAGADDPRVAGPRSSVSHWRTESEVAAAARADGARCGNARECQQQGG